MTDFQIAKRLFKKAFIDLTRSSDTYEITYEAAFPAYAHKNPLIDYIFWKRLQVCYEYILKQEHKSVLDFGCGSGIMSYLLGNQNCSVTACDLELGPLNLIKDAIPDFPELNSAIEGDIRAASQPVGPFDVIVALDVLEHITDLDEHIAYFKTVLKPGGEVIISGPTENFFYRMGRKLSGKKFTGEYHVTNIDRIEDAFSQQMQVTTIANLIPPISLFKIIAARD